MTTTEKTLDTDEYYTYESQMRTTTEKSLDATPHEDYEDYEDMVQFNIEDSPPYKQPNCINGNCMVDIPIDKFSRTGATPNFPRSLMSVKDAAFQVYVDNYGVMRRKDLQYLGTINIPPV